MMLVMFSMDAPKGNNINFGSYCPLLISLNMDHSDNDKLEAVVV